MDTPLNLSPERSGPSVWDVPQQPSSPWGFAALAIGAAMMAAAWRRPERRWLLAMGTGGVFLGLLASLPVEDLQTRIRARRSVGSSDSLDEALSESFPASDPPAASTPSTTPPSPSR